MTTPLLLDTYTQFCRRVYNERTKDDDRLLLLANMMDYMTRIGHDQECLVYWPRTTIPLTRLSCIVSEALCLDSSNEIQFAVCPVSFTAEHRYNGTHCCKYCHFATMASYDEAEFIPSPLVLSLFEKIKYRRQEVNKKSRAIPPPAVVTQPPQIIYTEVHTINVTQSFMPPGIMESIEYTHYRDNSNFLNGYTMTGALEGHFRLDMRRIKGIIGVSPVSPSLSYTMIVSSSAVIRLENYSPFHSSTRFIEITFVVPGATRVTTTTVPYNALHQGYPLSRLVDGVETLECHIRSNDSLIVMFNEFREINTLHIQQGASSHVNCKCMCNVEYAAYSLWYNESPSTLVPLNCDIEVPEMVRQICLVRSQSFDGNRRIDESVIPIGKPSDTVNGSFDTKGSMETYFDVIDLIGRLKVTDTNVNSVARIPEFYFAGQCLSVRQLRKPSTSGSCRSSFISHGSDLVDQSLFWAIFYQHRALTLFEVSGRSVLFKPIIPGEQFDVVNYVVY